jgi:hypothetical protein
MKDSSDHRLNGGGIIPVHHNGPDGTIISTIGGDILIPKCTDRIVNTFGLGPQVCFAPSNCLAYDGPNLTNR